MIDLRNLELVVKGDESAAPIKITFKQNVLTIDGIEPEHALSIVKLLEQREVTQANLDWLRDSLARRPKLSGVKAIEVDRGLSVSLVPEGPEPAIIDQLPLPTAPVTNQLCYTLSDLTRVAPGLTSVELFEKGWAITVEQVRPGRDNVGVHISVYGPPDGEYELVVTRVGMGLTTELWSRRCQRLPTVGPRHEVDAYIRAWNVEHAVVFSARVMEPIPDTHGPSSWSPYFDLTRQ